MKKVLFSTIVLLVFALPAFADTIVLNDPEDLDTPTSSVLVWDEVRIENQGKRMRVIYHWENATGQQIMLANRRQQQVWWCMDRDEIPAQDPLDCTDVGVPYECCTGAGTGTGCYGGQAAETCFSDTFGFTIRTQDVGTKLGLGLRTLIWSKMRDDILTTGNDGAFQ